MGIKTNLNKTTITAMFDARMDVLMQQIIQALHNAGLNAVTHSRTMHKYTDRTGNLTSSVGYAIVYNGQIVDRSNFEQINEGSQGSQEGQSYLQEIASQFPTGLQLIIVAGMPYAGYVEAMGLDVLDSASLLAVNEAKQKINDVLSVWNE